MRQPSAQAWGFFWSTTADLPTGLACWMVSECLAVGSTVALGFADGVLLTAVAEEATVTRVA
jgi:hypothetical protein